MPVSTHSSKYLLWIVQNHSPRISAREYYGTAEAAQLLMPTPVSGCR